MKASPPTTTFTMSSSATSGLNAWPGGTTTLAQGRGCDVTIALPSGTISNLSGDTWAITAQAGYASCSLQPSVPQCGSTGSSPSLLTNRRPYCSNSAASAFDNVSRASVSITCTP